LVFLLFKIPAPLIGLITKASKGQLCSLDISLSPAEENSDQKNCSDPFFDAVNNVKVEFSIPEENEFYKMDKVEVQT
jgi:hypothetical protein